MKSDSRTTRGESELDHHDQISKKLKKYDALDKNVPHDDFFMDFQSFIAKPSFFDSKKNIYLPTL